MWGSVSWGVGWGCKRPYFEFQISFMLRRKPYFTLICIYPCNCCIFNPSVWCTLKKTFTTLCSYQPDRGSSGHIYAIKEDQESSIRLHFIKFETKYIEMCVNFIKDNILTAAHKDKALKATGNFKSLMESLKKVSWKKEALTKNSKCPNAFIRQHTYSPHDKHPGLMLLKLPLQYLTMPYRKYH